MSHRWYDPLTERWYTMPEKKLREPSPYERFLDELDALQAGTRQREIARTWEAVTATATASQMETPCLAGSGSAASES